MNICGPWIQSTESQTLCSQRPPPEAQEIVSWGLDASVTPSSSSVMLSKWCLPRSPFWQWEGLVCSPWPLRVRQITTAHTINSFFCWPAKSAPSLLRGLREQRVTISCSKVAAVIWVRCCNSSLEGERGGVYGQAEGDSSVRRLRPQVKFMNPWNNM